MKHLLCAVAISATMFSFSGVVEAAPITYFGQNLTPAGSVSGDPVTARNNFLAGLSGGVGTEDFEGFTDGDGAPLNLTFPGSTGNITATLSGAGTAIESGAGAGRFATSGSQYVETPGGGDFIIDFGTPVAAFGFYGTDLGDIGNDLVITLTDTSANDTSFTINVAGSDNGNLLFWGFIDTGAQYTRISFDNTPGSGDVFGFDDMTIGDAQQVVIIPVPEPIPLVFITFGIFALWFTRRRPLA